MSAPVREPADGPSKDGLLDYAPKRVRDPESEPNPGAPVTGDAAPPSRAPESAEPPWKRLSRQRETVAADAVRAARRNKLALAPDRPPDPPPPPSNGPKNVLAGPPAGVPVVTAVPGGRSPLGSSPPRPPAQ